MKIDSNYNIETSEGVVLSVPLADPVARAYAFAIDLIAIFIFCVIIGFVVSWLFSDGTSTGILLLLLFFMNWGYFIVGEVFFNGSSIGKKRLKIRVVTDDLRPVKFSHSIIRNLIRVADFLPGMFGFGLIALLFNKNNKRLGDMAAGTIVITQKQYIRKYQQIKLEEPSSAIAIDLTNEEKRTIVDLAFFYETGAVTRTEEIASNLKPYMNNEPSNVIVKQLRLFAKWILGQS